MSYCKLFYLLNCHRYINSVNSTAALFKVGTNNEKSVFVLFTLHPVLLRLIT